MSSSVRTACYVIFVRLVTREGSDMLHLALKSDMNREAENSGNHRVTRTLCSSSRIPLGHPNVVGAISGYKAVVAQPSSLGILWHAHIYIEFLCWRISRFPWNFLRGLSTIVNQQVLLHFGRAFVVARHDDAVKARRQAHLVKIEFQSVYSRSNRRTECQAIALIQMHLACRKDLCT